MRQGYEISIPLGTTILFGSGIGLIKYNSRAKRDGIRDPEGIKVVCSKYCFSASHFGTPEKIPDKDTIGYMAYRWNQRKGCI